jgi:hypothetical protein
MIDDQLQVGGCNNAGETLDNRMGLASSNGKTSDCNCEVPVIAGRAKSSTSSHLSVGRSPKLALLMLLPTATCSGELQLTLTSTGVSRFDNITMRQSIANREARKAPGAVLAMFHVIQSASESFGDVIVQTVKDLHPGRGLCHILIIEQLFRYKTF